MSEKKFSILARLRSFKYAFRGFVHLFRNEHNAWIHMLAAITVVIMGFSFRISADEWILIIIAIGIVFITELINTSIENLVDLLHPDKSPKAGKIKDLAAAAVLVSAIVAAIIGLIIFLPKIISLT